MKLPAYLRLSKQRIYIFRRRIPIDIAHWFTTDEIRQSLRTGNLTQATRNARILAAETEALFFKLRNDMLTDDDKNQFKRMLDAKRLELRLRDEKEALGDALINQKLKLNEISRQHERELALVLAASKVVVTAAPASPLLSELISEFLSADQVHRRGDRPATHRKDSDALHLFLGIVGDKPIHEVVQADAALYADKIRTFNSRDGERAIGTVNNHMGSVSKFSGWVMAFHSDAGHKQLEFKSLRFKKTKKASEERQMFDPSEVEMLLNHPKFREQKSHDPSKYWLILIAAFTGMRLEEIAQLHPRNDVLKDQDGTLIFDINDKDGKSLKTTSGARRVPVHQTLIDLGLLDYVESIKGATKFFPDTKERDARLGKNIGKKANYFINKVIGIKGKTLHSFRHTFATQLKRGGVEESVAAALVGHSHGGITYTRYGKGYKPCELKRVLEANVCYCISST